ncbi:ankyrin repeat domain-containing protein [Lacinutrix jangbogonensis]|uniref:ankyrin repeat domain-containing protein n=1 Tax=Lacinutrix jangbogonensis TaxID=1469557 RepID=UPI00053DAA40|nr:ankyrin repeat domain-containing protein [Lacinutrix jangbogonensis]
MKKTIIISAIALSFSLASLNATTVTSNYNSCEIESVYSVNSFCLAIVKGQTEVVSELIKLGENINEMSNGLTPLMYAAKFNRVEILEILIANGANLSAKSYDGKTAKYYAKISKADDTYAIIEEALSKK